MADYIDREDLINFIKLPDNPLSQNEFMRNFIIGMIVDAPSVDAVEVIKCLKCRYSEYTLINGLCDGLFCYKIGKPVDDDFYCKWGKKE
jgi:hypothetical protein